MDAKATRGFYQTSFAKQQKSSKNNFDIYLRSQSFIDEQTSTQSSMVQVQTLLDQLGVLGNEKVRKTYNSKQLASILQQIRDNHLYSMKNLKEYKVLNKAQHYMLKEQEKELEKMKNEFQKADKIAKLVKQVTSLYSKVLRMFSDSSAQELKMLSFIKDLDHQLQMAKESFMRDIPVANIQKLIDEHQVLHLDSLNSHTSTLEKLEICIAKVKLETNSVSINLYHKKPLKQEIVQAYHLFESRSQSIGSVLLNRHHFGCLNKRVMAQALLETQQEVSKYVVAKNHEQREQRVKEAQNSNINRLRDQISKYEQLKVKLETTQKQVFDQSQRIQALELDIKELKSNNSQLQQKNQQLATENREFKRQNETDKKILDKYLGMVIGTGDRDMNTQEQIQLKALLANVDSNFSHQVQTQKDMLDNLQSQISSATKFLKRIQQNLVGQQGLKLAIEDFLFDFKYTEPQNPLAKSVTFHKGTTLAPLLIADDSTLTATPPPLSSRCQTLKSADSSSFKFPAQKKQIKKSMTSIKPS